MSKLNKLITNLEKATKTLEDILKHPYSEINRDATIQRFEYTFELTWKLLKTYLDKEGVKVASPKATFRHAAKLGLIDDIEQWFDFLEARNLSSHVYEQTVADKVYSCAKRFLPFAKKVLKAIKKRF